MKANWLILFRGVIAVESKNFSKPMIECEQTAEFPNVTISCMYNNHYNLNPVYAEV
jgi:hypothetical protein